MPDTGDGGCDEDIKRNVAAIVKKMEEQNNREALLDFFF
jgi:hypothetical protein